MYELAHVETVYANPAAHGVPRQNIPDATEYPWPNVRIIGRDVPKLLSLPAESIEAVEMSEQDIPEIIIGGVKQYALDIRRAAATSAYSHSLAIEGTVSYESHRAKIENRRHIAGRTLHRVLGWIGIHHAPLRKLPRD